MFKRIDRNQARVRRHIRLRKKLSGTAERPRLSVYKSLHHIYAQIIDDVQGRTLLSASTVDPEIRSQVNGYGGNIESAKVVGKILAQKAKEKGITKVVFDRGGYKFHGRVAALAEAARENGLEF
ncbi:MAG: 50S ribosomal protein L18 [Firmicutes bacterium]|nr:50S ribosomal protein L18 [Bacillota bacterium]